MSDKLLYSYLLNLRALSQTDTSSMLSSTALCPKVKVRQLAEVNEQSYTEQSVP